MLPVESIDELAREWSCRVNGFYSFLFMVHGLDQDVIQVLSQCLTFARVCAREDTERTRNSLEICLWSMVCRKKQGRGLSATSSPEQRQMRQSKTYHISVTFAGDQL